MIVIDSCRILVLHEGVLIQPKHTMKVTVLSKAGRLSWFFYACFGCISLYIIDNKTIIAKPKFGGNSNEIKNGNESEYKKIHI